MHETQNKILYLSNHKMGEILGLGLGFSALVGNHKPFI